MFGAEFTYNHFKSSAFNEDPAPGTPDGSIKVQRLNAYGIYGVNDWVNLIVSVPFEHWRHSTTVTDIHLQNTSIQGMGDMVIGCRWLVLNQTESSGHRFFAGIHLSIPTGKSFNIKLFSEEAQLVPHRHFAIGRGHYAATLNLEWWHRLTLPVLAGITGYYDFPLNQSSVGFKSGEKLSLSLHTTLLKTLFWNTHLNMRLYYRYDSPDYWDNIKAMNTGGKYVNGAVALFFNVSKSLSLIASADFPIWRNIEGAQLDNFLFSLSFRKIMD